MRYNLFVHLGTQGGLPVPAEALSYWIVGILYHYHTPATREEIQQFLRSGEYSPHPLDVSIGRVDAAIELGIRNSLFNRPPTGEIALTNSTKAALDKKQEDLLAIESAAFEEWLVEIRHFLPENIVLESARTLWSAVYESLPLLVSATIDELAGLSSDNDWIAEAASRYPNDSTVVSLAIRLFMHASDNPDSACRRLLEHALMNAIFAYRTTVPNDYLNEVTTNIKGKRILLDTNVLLAIVGLSGDSAYEDSVRAFARSALELGFKLYYTRATADEYSFAIKKTLDEISQPFNPNRKYARGSWRHLERGIRRAYLESGLDKPTFLTRYRDLEIALKERVPELEIRSEGRYDEEYFRQMNRDGKYQEDFSRAYGLISNLPSKADASPHVIKHDALHFALLNIINGEGGGDYPKIFFVTADHSLASTRRKDVLSLATWFATFGSLQPVAEDFQKYFFDVVRAIHFYAFQADPTIVERFLSLVAAASDATTRESIEGVVSQALSVYGVFVDHSAHASGTSGLRTNPLLDPEGALKEIHRATAEAFINYEEKTLHRREQEREKLYQALEKVSADIADYTKRLREVESPFNEKTSDIKVFVSNIRLILLYIIPILSISLIIITIYVFKLNINWTIIATGVAALGAYFAAMPQILKSIEDRRRNSPEIIGLLAERDKILNALSKLEREQNELLKKINSLR